MLAKQTHSVSKQKEKMIEVTGQQHQTFIKTYFLVSLSYAAVWSDEELAVYTILTMVFLERIAILKTWPKGHLY